MSRPPSPRQAASRRLAELIVIGKYRRLTGCRLDPGKWLFYLANTLGHAPASTAPMRSGAIWRGIDLLELRRVVTMIDLGEFTDDELGEQIARIKIGSPLIASQSLGEQIGLTVEERDNLDVRSIGAAGQSKEARDEAKRERNRAADRGRKAAEREEARAAGQVKPRLEYCAGSFEATKPWIEERCSRRTWYYRRKKELLANIAQVASEIDGTLAAQVPSGIFGTSAAQVQSDHLTLNRVDGPDLCNVADVALSDRLQRSGPSTGPDLGAAFAVADRSTNGASAGSDAPDKRDGLGDGCSPPKSEAPKKETGRTGRTVLEKDPREQVLVEIFRDRTLAAYIGEEVGAGHFETGLKLADALGRSRLERLRDQVARAGVLSQGAEAAIAEARSLAIRLIREAEEDRHVAHA